MSLLPYSARNHTEGADKTKKKKKSILFTDCFILSTIEQNNILLSCITRINIKIN